MEWKIPRLKEAYEKRKRSLRNAFKKVKPGDTIFIGTGCAEPQYLVRSMADHPEFFADTEILHLISLNESPPYTDPRYRHMFRLNTFFIGSAAREAVARGDADYTPLFLSEIPKLIKTERLHIDVALIQVTPPDTFGNCSLGMSVETVKAAVEKTAYVIAQVNPRMPRTLGDSFVSVEDLDAIIEYDEPVSEFIPPEIDDIADQIGYYVSRLVPNGATIQAGIGVIPNAVLKHLIDKRNLGVHTEMFSDGLIDLYEAGVITNTHKTFHPGKVIAAFCLGSRRLYDTIDNNPVFEFYPTDYVSDPRNISKNDNMVAINSALEIDLTGQVCADSIGHKFYSGIGGQADFVRGASLARNGRPVIALPSTAKGGTISRIVPILTPGAGVVTTRGDVHYVVTEYGIAYLHGKTIRQRALALVNIAHPKFRQRLLDEAKSLRYIYQDQTLPPEGGSIYPENYTWSYMVDGEREIRFRVIKPIDEDKIRNLFYNLREEDIYYRFMCAVKTLPHSKALPLVVLDYEEKFAIAGYVGNEPDEQFVSVARWLLDRATNMAEVAFTVVPEWQGKGIGYFMLGKLIEVAKSKGISGFTAEVLASNRKMLSVFHRSGFNVHSQLDDGVYNLSFRFDETLGRE
ncbi:MAG: GNAT family N-acetyltransferase [Candidatus Latescibacteria bacterium]|nr:GNAT family N-acetyltransferase [Candidatus Latescibacterota bacterium]